MRDLNKSSYAEHRTKRHRLERIVDSDERESVTMSREWQGASARGQQ